jgi:hypothetical protein
MLMEFNEFDGRQKQPNLKAVFSYPHIHIYRW